MPGPVIKRFNENLTLASFEQIAVVYFPAKSPAAQEVQTMNAHLLDIALAAPSGFGLLLVIPEQAGPPEGKVREQVTAMFQSMKGRMKALAGVLEGEGFGAAAKRSVLTVLVSVGFASKSVKVFSEVGAGCEWLVSQARIASIGCPEPVDLLACVTRMRA